MKELLFSLTKKDFEVSYFSGSGAGGQHRNRHQNCVRIRHPESGVMVVSQEEKSRERNKKKSFSRLVEHKKFKDWLRVKTAEAMMDKVKIEDKVDRMMNPENLKFEYF